MKEFNLEEFSNSVKNLFKDYQDLYSDINFDIKSNKSNESNEEKDSEEIYPLVNFYEKEYEYLMHVIAPYNTKNDLNVDVHDGYIIITGNETIYTTTFGFKLKCEYYPPKTFKRKFKLKDNIDINKITASYNNGGILSISMPIVNNSDNIEKNIDIK